MPITNVSVDGGSDPIVVGDAVVAFYNSGSATFKARRANTSTLGVMPTVWGIVYNVPVAGEVDIAIPGDPVDDATIMALGAGPQNIVAVDPTAATGASNLIRVPTPNGSEFVVGTCDTSGNISVQTRASQNTSPQHVFNVCAYGAIGDSGVTDNSGPISNAMAAIPSTGGTLFFPAATGEYAVLTALTGPIHDYVNVVFEEGAVLAPDGVQVEIDGRITAQPTQVIFDGTGYSDSYDHSAGTGPDITLSGNPLSDYSALTIAVQTGGALGTMTFQYSVDGGTRWSDVQYTVSGASMDYAIFGTGVIVTFPGGGSTYAGDVYTWASHAAIVLGPNTLHEISVIHFGADPTGTADSSVAYNLAIRATPPTALAPTRTIIAPAGTYSFLNDYLHVTRGVELRGTGNGQLNAATHLYFNAPFGIITHSGTTTPEESSDPEFPLIRNFRIDTIAMSVGIRVPGNSYSVGDQIRFQDDNGYFYECLVAGTASMDANPAPTYAATPVALPAWVQTHPFPTPGYAASDGAIT